MKKSNVSRHISVFMAFALMAACLMEFVPVKAQEACPFEVVDKVALDTEISPRGALCPDCNIGEMQVSNTEWGEWYHYQEVKCTHYPYGTDEVFRKDRTMTEICTHCSRGSSIQQYETKKVCHGYR